MNLTVFPVEYHAILDQLRQYADAEDAEKITFDDAAECGFLSDDLCSIYDVRPIICRTHGPAVSFIDDSFIDDNTDQPARAVSFCPKCFTTANDDDLDFGPENTLDLEQLNASLYAVNLQFGKESGDAAFGKESGDAAFDPTTRIPLRQLVDDLAK